MRSKEYRKYFDEQKPYTWWVDVYIELKELFLSAYRWEGFPDTVNTRYLNLLLFEFGQAIIFEEDEVGMLALQPQTQGWVNVYGEPSKLRAIGKNGYISDEMINHRDCVVIYHNLGRYCPSKRLEDYAKRIAHIENTIDINVNAQKTPYFVKSTQETENSFKNILKQMGDFEPAVYVDQDYSQYGDIVIPTVAPYVSDKLFELKKKLWNEVLSFIGIDNNSSEKTERLTDDEVQLSNGLSVASRNSKLMARELAVAEINKLFNLNVNVAPTNPSMLELARVEGGVVDE